MPLSTLRARVVGSACAAIVSTLCVTLVAHADPPTETPGELAPPARKTSSPSNAPRPISDAERAELAVTARELTDSVSHTLREARRHEQLPLTLDHVLEKTGKHDIDAIYAYVDAHLRHEPYRGALRSPEVVLATGSANAVDAARLLHALLTRAGHMPRYAWGRLPDKVADEVLAEVVGSGTTLVKGEAWKSADEPLPLGLRAAVQEHVWVELTLAGEIVSLDPIASPLFGATMARREGGGSELPATMRSTFAMSLHVTFKDGREAKRVPVSGALDRFTQRPISIALEPDASLAHVMRPVLMVGVEEAVVGDYFAIADVAQLALHFELESGGTQRIWQQVLYERPAGEDHVLEAEQLHVSVTVLPGWVSDGLVLAQGGEGFLAALSRLGALGMPAKPPKKGEKVEAVQAAKLEREVMHELARAFPYLFVRQLDRTSRELARELGVTPILGSPRIVITAMVREQGAVFLEADLQGSGLQAVAARGVPQSFAQGFVSLQGRLESEIKADVLDALTAEPTYTTGEFFDVVEKQRVPVTTLWRGTSKQIKALEVSEAVKRRLTTRVKRAGEIVLAPRRAVQIRGASRYGWWELDPVEGQLAGRAAHGLFNQPFAGVTPAGERSAGVSALTLSGLTGKQLGVWLDALDATRSAAPRMCAASDDLLRIGKGLCAVKRARPLPTLASCLASGEGALSEGKRGETVLGDPLGGGFEAESCDDLVAPLRCGAVVSRAVLRGEVRVSRGEASAGEAMCRK